MSVSRTLQCSFRHCARRSSRAPRRASRSRPASRSARVSGTDFVRDHASPFEPGSVRGDEITVGVDQDVAVRQLVEERGQRLTHRRLAKHARAADRLHAAGEAFRRAAAHRVHEDRDRPAEDGSTRSPAASTRRGFATKRTSVSRVFIMPSGLRSSTKVPGDAHHHRREPAGIAAQVDDDAVRCAEFVHRLLKQRIDGRHPHVEAR